MVNQLYPKQNIWLATLIILLLNAQAAIGTPHSSIVAVESEAIPFYNTALQDFTKSFNNSDSGENAEITEITLTGNSKNDTENIIHVLAKKPQLILTFGTNATLALSDIHPGIPTLFSMILDPMSLGVVKTLDNPGGEFTGTTLMVSPGKQFQALLQILPKLKNIGVLYTADDPTSMAVLDEAKKESQEVGLSIVAQPIPTGQNVDRATLERMATQVDAFWMIPDPASVSSVALSLTFSVAAEHKIAVLGDSEASVHAGALLALSASQTDLGAEEAEMALQILQGAEPDSMGVRGPRRTKLSLNLDVAKTLAITIPDSVLRLADEVIDTSNGK